MNKKYNFLAIGFALLCFLFGTAQATIVYGPWNELPHGEKGCFMYKDGCVAFKTVDNNKAYYYHIHASFILQPKLGQSIKGYIPGYIPVSLNEYNISDEEFWNKVLEKQGKFIANKIPSQNEVDNSSIPYTEKTQKYLNSAYELNKKKNNLNQILKAGFDLDLNRRISSLEWYFQEKINEQYNNKFELSEEDFYDIEEAISKIKKTKEYRKGTPEEALENILKTQSFQNLINVTEEVVRKYDTSWEQQEKDIQTFLEEYKTYNDKSQGPIKTEPDKTEKTDPNIKDPNKPVDLDSNIEDPKKPNDTYQKDSKIQDPNKPTDSDSKTENPETTDDTDQKDLKIQDPTENNPTDTKPKPEPKSNLAKIGKGCGCAVLIVSCCWGIKKLHSLALKSKDSKKEPNKTNKESLEEVESL